MYRIPSLLDEDIELSLHPVHVVVVPGPALAHVDVEKVPEQFDGLFRVGVVEAFKLLRQSPKHEIVAEPAAASQPELHGLNDSIFHISLPSREGHDQACSLENFSVGRRGLDIDAVEVGEKFDGVLDGALKCFFGSGHVH